MKAAAVAPLRSSSSSKVGSSGPGGAKAVKKLRRGEGSAGRSRSSDSAAARSTAQLQQDASSSTIPAFCTPSLPCWAAAERDALEQLTDEFFSRHRLHLRVWPVSAGSGASSGEPAAVAGGAQAAALGGCSSSSRSAGGGGEVASRKGRAATAAANGREEQSRKEGGRGSSALERKASAEGEPLRRAGSVGATGGPAAAAADSSGNRRASAQKGRATAAGGETSTLYQTEEVGKIKYKKEAHEEEDEATKVRREQLLNVRAMLYDRVTENVSFTCTEYNTPTKPSRNAKLPGFLQLRGVRICGNTNLSVYEDSAAAGDPVARRGPAAADDTAGAGAGGGAENVEASRQARLRQVLQKENGTTAGDGGSCSEPGAADAAAATMLKGGGGVDQQQRDDSSSTRGPQPQQQGTPTAAATTWRKSAKLALQKDETAGGIAIDGGFPHLSSKQASSQVHQDAPGDADACGDPGKLKELQQSLLSDGFTGCWVLLLTEKYVPPTSPLALSPQHGSHRVNQTCAASSFAPEAAGGEAALGENAADAVAGERGDGGAAGQQDVVQQELQQQRQPRVRRIIVCGALIEVYSNNERQIAALWCLPCLSAHATRLLLQAFLPRVLLEALRIPDVAATPEEEEHLEEEKISALHVGDSGGSSKKRKWRQEGGLREAGRGGEQKQQQQQRQQRSSGGVGNYQKRTTGEEGHTKQQNGYYLHGGEKARRRKSSCSAEEAENNNVSAVRRGDGRSGAQLCDAVKERGAEQPQQLLRPIKSVFAVYEDILLWPRQALFLLASPSRLGFMRHAEPLLGVPPEEEEEENVAVAVRKISGAEEKHRGNSAYRKQPYLHVDAGLGPQWRECNCRRRFFSSRLQFAQQRRRRGGTTATSSSSSSKGGGSHATRGGGNTGAAEEANGSSSRRGGGGGAAAATVATWGRAGNASTSRRDSSFSREASPNGDGLLRFFSVSDLWAARLMPPRERRAALEQAELAAGQLPAAGAAQRKQEGLREAEAQCISSSTTALAGTSTDEKPVETSQSQTGVEAMGESWSSPSETTKQEGTREKVAEPDIAAAAKAAHSSAGREGGQEAVWSSEQQYEQRMKAENGSTLSSKLWPEATDGWSCLVPRGTSEQILREIYCDLPVLSVTNFEECLAEEVDVSQDEMCGLPESECRELLRWWDK